YLFDFMILIYFLYNIIIMLFIPKYRLTKKNIFVFFLLNNVKQSFKFVLTMKIFSLIGFLLQSAIGHINFTCPIVNTDKRSYFFLFDTIEINNSIHMITSIFTLLIQYKTIKSIYES